MTTIAMTSGDWVGTAASWMLTYLIHSTILILAVWLLVRGIKPIAARIRPSAENLAWKLALVGAFVTATAQIAAGVQPALGALELETQARAVAPTAGPQASPAATIHVAPADRPVIVVDESEAMMLGAQPAAAPTPPAAAPEPGPAPLWPKLLLLAWAIGAALMLVRLLLAARTLRQRLRGRGPVLEDPVLESFLTLCRDAEIARTIKLTQSDRIASPIALWRREIVVPERAVAELSPAAMRSVLAHELAHLERRDPLWLVFAAVIEALCFFQPLNWLARRGMQESAELLCDDWAIARTGDGIAFAKSLHEVASWEQANRSSLLLAGMIGGERPLVRRVRRALDGDPGRFESDTSPRPARMLVGLGSLAALILVAPGAVDASPPLTGDAPSRKSAAAEARAQAEAAQVQRAQARAAEAKAAAEAAQREADRLAAEARAAAEAAARANGSGGPHLILRDGDEYLRIDENGVTLRSKDADIDIVDDGTQNPRLRMRVREGGSELDLDVDLDTLEGLGNMAMGLLGEELLQGVAGAPPAPGAPVAPPAPPSAFGGAGGFDALGALELLGGLEGLGGLDEQALERELEALERELEQELLRELGDAFGGAFGGGQPSAPPAPSMPSVAPQPPVQPTQPSGPLTLI